MARGPKRGGRPSAAIAPRDVLGAGVGGKPWHRSTVVVSLVSLVGAVLALAVSQFLADNALAGGLGWWEGALPGSSGLGEDAEEDRHVHAAAEAFRRGNREFSAGRLDHAQRLFEEAVALSPTHSFAWANLGNVLQAAGDQPRAIEAHRTATALLPTRARHWYNLGVSLYSARELEPAVDAFEHAVALNGRLAAGFFNLGVALAELGKRSEARDAYRTAAGLEPTSAAGLGAQCNLCNMLQVDEGSLAAVVCLRALLQVAPAYERALVNLAGTLHGFADSRDDGDGCGGAGASCRSLLDEARGLFQRVREINPANPLAAHALRALSSDSGAGAGDGDGGDGDGGASAEYVEQLFDAFASNFDELLASLQYRVPALLDRAVAAAAAARPEARLGSPEGDVLDVGCGTGLSAEWLRPWARPPSRLVGVDLSSRMLELARRRVGPDQAGLYDELVHGDAEAAVAARPPESAALVVAADVLCYFGALSDLLRAVARTLRPGGVVAFTVEAMGDDAPGDWHLHSSGRFRHSKAYVLGEAQGAGLSLVSEDVVVARRLHSESDSDAAAPSSPKDVLAHLFVFWKPATPS